MVSMGVTEQYLAGWESSNTPERPNTQLVQLGIDYYYDVGRIHQFT